MPRNRAYRTPRDDSAQKAPRPCRRPYYTVRPPVLTGSIQNTLLSIANSSLDGKVVRLRFREGRAGASVFEANVLLSPWDVWTAALVPTDAGVTLLSTGLSCTQPVRLFHSITAGRPPDGKFVNDAYVDDPMGLTVDCLLEGSFEVLELGTVKEGTATWATIRHLSGVATCTLASDKAITADLSH